MTFYGEGGVGPVKGLIAGLMGDQVGNVRNPSRDPVPPRFDEPSKIAVVEGWAAIGRYDLLVADRGSISYMPALLRDAYREVDRVEEVARQLELAWREADLAEVRRRRQRKRQGVVLLERIEARRSEP